MHNIRIVCMSKKRGLDIGKMISEVLELDAGSTGLCLGKFLRVHVWFDIKKPLLKAINVVVKKKKPPLKIFLSYERLPDFCMNNRVLDHVVRDCIRLPNNTKITPGAQWKYKSWIRAQSLVQLRYRPPPSSPKRSKPEESPQGRSPSPSMIRKSLAANENQLTRLTMQPQSLPIDPRL